MNIIEATEAQVKQWMSWAESEKKTAAEILALLPDEIKALDINSWGYAKSFETIGLTAICSEWGKCDESKVREVMEAFAKWGMVFQKPSVYTSSSFQIRGVHKVGEIEILLDILGVPVPPECTITWEDDPTPRKKLVARCKDSGNVWVSEKGGGEWKT